MTLTIQDILLMGPEQLNYGGRGGPDKNNKILGSMRRNALSAVVMVAALGVTMSVGQPSMAAETTALLPPGSFGYSGSAGSGVVPQVLGAEDAERYREIFEVQEAGSWSRADRLIRGIENPILMGHVLFQRYMHPTAYRSSWKELRGWMSVYRDLPGAYRIYRLANKRKPSGAAGPKSPVGKSLRGNGADAIAIGSRPYVSPKRKSASARRELARMRSEMRKRIGRGHPTGALNYLQSAAVRKATGPIERADDLGRIAHGYFVFDRDEKALKYATLAAERGGDAVMEANWTAGLAAWRLGKLDRAGTHFEALANSQAVGAWTRSAGAFWASRVHLVQRRPAVATRWLAKAATFSATFYGLLARRALGVQLPYDWTVPRPSQASVDAIIATKGGKRALALIQVGRNDLAAAELRHVYYDVEEQHRLALMSIATAAELPGIAMRVAGVLRAAGGRPYFAALFPVPSWETRDTFDVDRALIFGIMRQESHFNPDARSRRGARGLMQLMPRTAKFVANDQGVTDIGRKKLYDPEINMLLGRRYIRHLLDHPAVDGNLFRLLAAYNAGPGNLRKWSKKVDFKGDPLLFIESIPSGETRNFIEKVLTNVWMYRMRLGQPTPSLDQVAAGSWPTYLRLDPTVQEPLEHARN